MAEPYKQVDLGYPRQPTSDVVVVTFSNGESWSVPVQVIADSRDRHYETDHEDTAKFIADKTLDTSDVTEWLQGNMNWSDVEPYARRMAVPVEIDKDVEFANAYAEYLHGSAN